MSRTNFAIVLFSLCFSCSQNKLKDKPEAGIHFTYLPSSNTKIIFENSIIENDSVNLITNAYAYMGSGVGIGDFNNDGLQDIVFGANQKSSRLYLNKGNLHFEDISDKAGLSTSEWITGINIVDINNDGFDDIYACVSVTNDASARKNKLFINDGHLKFTEQAAAYGLADTSYSTQAVFLDYDKDGDLDMYLMNHLMNHSQSNIIVAPDRSGRSPARDKLFRNNGTKKGQAHPFFEDVSLAAGINEDGYGLGLSVTDVNNDNWPDIYVANDYLANDILWLNNKNGTFTNIIDRSMRHQSYSSMGVDASDINNDGLPDVLSLDMMPEDNIRKKMMYSFMNYDRYYLERNAGYQPEFMRNMLQLNNGIRSIRDTALPFFSEVGQLAGISETDWSWSVLLADLDNDGWKDVHMTNGLGRDMINSDFITYWSSAGPETTTAARYKAVIKKLEEYGTVELNNYCFRNNGQLSFSNVTNSAGLDQLSISNGCAYADLDNDGDLDLVVNNINKQAFILQNDARSKTTDSIHNFLTVILKGDSLNLSAFGTKLTIYTGRTIQSVEQNPGRGYLSSVDKRLHFGLGKTGLIDSLMVVWPDNKRQTISNLKANTTITLLQGNARLYVPIVAAKEEKLFTDVSTEKGIDFIHKEIFFYDYGYQQLLPQRFTQLGPFMTEGDINGDGLTDLFVGGAAKQSGRFFLQQPDGRFMTKDLTAAAKEQEDMGSLLFDADGDKDLDLFINSGGYENDPGGWKNLPRLYKNDGQGNFTEDNTALPKTIFTSAQCVAGADYDGDGDIDLYIGGRVFPRQYPVIPESYLLQNNGGRFSIVTPEVAPGLQLAGMITSAIWTDLNNDKKPDLVIAGEYMPVRFFQNDGKKLFEVTGSTGLKNMNGQWKSLAAADLDNDGDMDIIAGNLGMNNKYKVTPDKPIRLYAKDIDGNGSVDPVVSYYINDPNGQPAQYPAISREQLSFQVPSIKKKFLLNADFAKADINTLFNGINRDDMQELLCDETRTVWLENKGNGKFVLHELPVEAQFAPVNSLICTDINADGFNDLIIAGNEYQTEIMTGRYDASYGLLMVGNGKGGFQSVAPVQSGLILDGDVKDMRILTTSKNEKLMIVAANDEPLRTFKLRPVK